MGHESIRPMPNMDVPSELDRVLNPPQTNPIPIGESNHMLSPFVGEISKKMPELGIVFLQRPLDQYAKSVERIRGRYEQGYPTFSKPGSDHYAWHQRWWELCVESLEAADCEHFFMLTEEINSKPRMMELLDYLDIPRQELPMGRRWNTM